MATPILEYIAQNLLTTIQSLSTDAGTLTAARPKLADFSDVSVVDLRTVLIQTDSEQAEAEAVGCREYMQNFEIAVYLITEDADTDTLDTRGNEVYAALLAALVADVTRGGYAINTLVGAPQFFKLPEMAVAGVSVEVTVHYRIVWNSATTQG